MRPHFWVRRLRFLFVRFEAGAAEDLRSLWHRANEPDVAADDGIGADHSFPSEDGGAGVNCYAILDGRVALDGAFIGLRELASSAQSTERHALVEPDIVTQSSGFSDDDSCTVIDEEPLANLRTGIDVDSRAAVSIFTDDPRNHRNAASVEDVSNAMGHDGNQGRIAKDDFFDASSCGVTVKGRHGVLVEDESELGELSEEVEGCSVSEIRVAVVHATCPGFVGYRPVNLLAEAFVGWVDVLTDGVAQILLTQRPKRVVAEKDDRSDVLKGLDDGAPIRHRRAFQVVDGETWLVALGDGVDGDFEIAGQVGDEGHGLGPGGYCFCVQSSLDSSISVFEVSHFL